MVSGDSGYSAPFNCRTRRRLFHPGPTSTDQTNANCWLVGWLIGRRETSIVFNFNESGLVWIKSSNSGELWVIQNEALNHTLTSWSALYPAACLSPSLPPASFDVRWFYQCFIPAQPVSRSVGAQTKGEPGRAARRGGPTRTIPAPATKERRDRRTDGRTCCYQPASFTRSWITGWCMVGQNHPIHAVCFIRDRL